LCEEGTEFLNIISIDFRRVRFDVDAVGFTATVKCAVAPFTQQYQDSLERF